MNALYGTTHRQLQDEYGTRHLADRLAAMAHAVFEPPERAFIEAATMLFLSTVDAQGQPTVSYKGGAPGFVRFSGASELVFPSYDGNGMFLSLGNVAATARVGLLFIDFARPHRLRVHGLARLSREADDLALYPGADCVVRVEAHEIFINCGRYIHDGAKLSRHLPDTQGRQPFPAWKRINVFADALPRGDAERVEAAGGTVGIEEYAGEAGPEGVIAPGSPRRSR